MLLQKNRFLSYDFDHCFQTGLHWACRRNHLEVAKAIMAAGGDTECKDIIG